MAFLTGYRILNATQFCQPLSLSSPPEIDSIVVTGQAPGVNITVIVPAIHRERLTRLAKTIMVRALAVATVAFGYGRSALAEGTNIVWKKLADVATRLCNLLLFFAWRFLVGPLCQSASAGLLALQSPDNWRLLWSLLRTTTTRTFDFVCSVTMDATREFSRHSYILSCWVGRFVWRVSQDIARSDLVRWIIFQVKALAVSTSEAILGAPLAIWILFRRVLINCANQFLHGSYLRCCFASLTVGAKVLSVGSWVRSAMHTPWNQSTSRSPLTIDWISEMPDLPLSNIQPQSFEDLGELGRGTFGTVKKMQVKGGKVLAVKVTDMRYPGYDKVARAEAHAMALLNGHRWFPSVEGCWTLSYEYILAMVSTSSQLFRNYILTLLPSHITVTVTCKI